MKVRAVITGVLVCAAAAYTVVQLRKLEPVLLTNKARWLMNQGDWAGAEAQLARVRERAPQSLRARELSALVALNQGAWDRAFPVIAQLPESRLKSFLRAAWAYGTNQEQVAAESMQEALGREGHLEPWMDDVTRMGAGQLPAGGVGILLAQAVKPDSGRGASPLAGRLWNAYGGRRLYALGRYEESVRLFSRAWQQHDRNRRSMTEAVTAAGGVGEFALAARIVDSASSRSQLLDLVVREAQQLTSATRSAMAATLRQAFLAEERRRGMRNLEAWAAVTAAQGNHALSSHAVETTQRIVDQAPGDPVAEVFHGDALDLAGRLRDAYLVYGSAYAESRAYPVLLRMADLAGWTHELKQREQELLSEERVVAHVAADQLATTGTVLRRDVLAYYDGGTAVAELEVPEDGEYAIALVAAGDRAFELSPVVALSIDGKRVEDLYVAREGWDLYVREAGLEKGHHSVEIRYINDRDRRPTPQQDRNFYLRRVLVMRAGGY